MIQPTFDRFHFHGHNSNFFESPCEGLVKYGGGGGGVIRMKTYLMVFNPSLPFKISSTG
ncbi:hypothetical protein Hanom_Chr07g00661341 [Helianthus anomalus]